MHLHDTATVHVLRQLAAGETVEDLVRVDGDAELHRRSIVRVPVDPAGDPDGDCEDLEIVTVVRRVGS